MQHVVQYDHDLEKVHAMLGQQSGLLLSISNCNMVVFCFMHAFPAKCDAHVSNYSRVRQGLPK